MIKVIAIAAAGLDGSIGRTNGDFPWHKGAIPSDMMAFKQITEGSALLMGRRTYDTLIQPLPGRHNMVLSRKYDQSELRTGFELVNDVEHAIIRAQRLYKDGVIKTPQLVVIGGAQIYKLAEPYIGLFFLNRVGAKFHAEVKLELSDKMEFETLVDFSRVMPEDQYVTARQYAEQSKVKYPGRDGLIDVSELDNEPPAGS